MKNILKFGTNHVTLNSYLLYIFDNNKRTNLNKLNSKTPHFKEF